MIGLLREGEKMVNIKNKIIHFALPILIAATIIPQAFAEEEIGSIDIKHIQTPDNVETSIGTLKFAYRGISLSKIKTIMLLTMA